MVSTKAVNFSSLFPDVAQSQAALQYRQALVDEINKQALTPMNPDRGPGVKISPWEGAAKIGEALIGHHYQNDVNQKNLALAQQMNQRMWGTQPFQNPDGGSVPQNTNASQLASTLSNIGRPEATMQPDLGTPQQMPWQGGTPGNGGGMMGNSFPNIPRDKLMMAMQLAPDELGKMMVNQYAPTDTMKNYQQAGMTPQEIGQAIRGEANNKGSINARAGSTVILPSGRAILAPDLNTGMAGGYDAQGDPYAYSMPGAIAAKAGMAGATKGAESANTIYPGQTVNGREGVPVWGSGQPIGAPVTPVSSQPIPPQGGGLNSPQGSPVVLGQTQAEKAQGAEQGKNAAEANEGYQKQKAAMDAIDAALNRLEQINPQAPSGNFGIASLKAGISNTLSPMMGMSPDSAVAAQTYKQLMDQNVLGGIKTLQGMGRLDLPEINKVVETYGVGMENHPTVRAEGIKNLRTMLHNNLATSQNSVSGLNTPQVPQVPPAQVQQYQGAQQPTQQTGQRIKVMAPNGQTGTVDAAHLQDILSQGGKVVQ